MVSLILGSVRALLVMSSLCVPLVACGDDRAGDEPPASGTELWQRRLSVEGHDVAVAPDGSSYVVGVEDGFWLGKFESDGTPLWSYTEAGTFGVAVVVGDDGGIYTAAYDWNNEGVGRRVARFEEDGAHAWTLEQETRTITALAPAPGGGVYAADGFGAGSASFFQRLSGDGQVLWSFEDALLTGVEDLALGAAGELVASGMGDTWWVAAWDEQGAPLWATELGPALPAGPFQSIAVEPDGTLSVAAMTQNEPDARGWFVRLDAAGMLLSTRSLAKPPTEIVHVDGGVALANLVPPSVEVQGAEGARAWAVDPPTDCLKTWALDATGKSPIIALRNCGEDGSQLVALQP